ncbi:MAG: hypothetical protein IJU41_07990 [Clostridia bacterium]|nr:hypothetical protein [Clostridia bacterium]
MPNFDLMDFMGFRYMLIEEKIEECLAAARRGETTIGIERGDLTDDELSYVQNEVRRRLEKG